MKWKSIEFKRFRKNSISENALRHPEDARKAPVRRCCHDCSTAPRCLLILASAVGLGEVDLISLFLQNSENIVHDLKKQSSIFIVFWEDGWADLDSSILI